MNMTNNETPKPVPGFRRKMDTSNAKFDVPGERLGQVMNDYHERRAEEAAEERRQGLMRTASKLEEFKKISAENATIVAGNPALKIVAAHAIAQLNRPKEAVTYTESEVDNDSDDREVMSLREVRQRMQDEYNEALDYASQTGDPMQYTYTDPVTYARNNNIRIW
jgi:hypothetical protein